ncbi:MAG TPA: 1,4-dihydroxy-2-naphthoate polyprenyltransferase [Microvirga sp.]|nr:1,4-dihydroxy-2-naphthoate polyprenyltransferase [Microvirga sp.]
MNIWVEAARPRTLVAGIVPVLVGTAASGRFIAPRFIAALIVGIAIQIGVNYANDLFDATRGVDRDDRIGPRRATAAGLVTPLRMGIGVACAFGVAATAGLYLAAVAGAELIAVGALCFVAALGYSGGPRPYASAGLGELFVFVFFGLIATTGSAYVQIEGVPATAVLAGVPVGCFATAILVVNNLRDIETDRRAGKVTLAVRLGRSRTRLLYGVLLLLAATAVAPVMMVANSLGPVLALGAAPLGLRALRLVAGGQAGTDLIAALGATAQLQLVFGLLLAAGLWIF